MVWTCFNGCAHVRTKVILVFYNFHGTSTENVRWTNQNWETNLVSSFNCFFFVSSCLSRWLRNIQFFQSLFKEVTVFSTVKISNLSTKNFDTSFRKWLSQVDSCLSTELNNNTFWLFKFDNIHNIFKC